MKLTPRARLAAIVAAALALTGCSPELPSPNTTLIHGKICALADSYGWDDQGLNRETYIALQKAKVAIGIALDIDQLALDAKHSDAQKRLTQFAKGGCSMVIASGDFLSPDVYKVAEANPQMQFVLSDHHFERTATVPGSHPFIPANLYLIANQLAEAAFQAGYLAAMSSQSHKVATLVAICSPYKPLHDRLATAFADGATYFSRHNAVGTEIITTNMVPKIAPASEAMRQTIAGLVEGGVDRIFVLSSKDFVTAVTVTEEFKDLQLIGAERDWAINKQTESAAPRILASVIRRKNSSAIFDLIAFVIGGATASPAPQILAVNDLTNAGVALTDAHSISYPSNFKAQMQSLIDSLTTNGGMTQ